MNRERKKTRIKTRINWKEKHVEGRLSLAEKVAIFSMGRVGVVGGVGGVVGGHWGSCGNMGEGGGRVQVE